MRKPSERNLPIDLMVESACPEKYKVVAPPKHREWDPISWGWNPSLLNPRIPAYFRRVAVMRRPVTHVGLGVGDLIEEAA